MAIYVKFAEEKKPKSIKEFLINFYNKSHYNQYGIASVTYNDKNCTIQQCNKDWRSYDELLELVQTYYPSTTSEKFIKILISVKIPADKEGEYFKPHLGTCSGMGKIRFIPYYMFGFHDYDNITINSKYTWKQLLEPINIKDQQDLVDYYDKN